MLLKDLKWEAPLSGEIWPRSVSGPIAIDARFTHRGFECMINIFRCVEPNRYVVYVYDRHHGVNIVPGLVLDAVEAQCVLQEYYPGR